MSRKRYTPEMAIRDVREQRKRILRVLRPFARHFKELDKTGWILAVEPVSLTGTGLHHSHLRAIAKLYQDLGGK